jgi:hypothetical protein
MVGTQRCPSIPKTRWRYAADSLRWIVSQVPQLRNLRLVYREGDEEEGRRARRNPLLDILREDDDAEQFHLMGHCLALLQPL